MSVYRCLSCGMELPDTQVGAGSNAAKCPSCGRNMYRQEGPPPGAPPGPGQARVTRMRAIPSRYATGGAVSPQFMQAQDDPDHNPFVVPRTPFIVILGFIFAIIMPPGGLIISILGYRLVNDSESGIRGKGLAIAGIAIGSVMTVLSFILVIASKS